MPMDAAERWRLRLLPLMRAALVVFTAFFFVASLVQYLQVYRDVRELPPSSVQLPDPPAGTSPATAIEHARWRTMVSLEQDALRLRYRQVNAVMLLRAWTRYTGFLVGMVLAMTGAFFILGRLQEGPTHLAAEAGGGKLDLTTQSPGIVLAVLGTVLMGVALFVRFDAELTDKPVYLLPAFPPQVKDQPPPAPLPQDLMKLRPDGEDFPPPPVARTSPAGQPAPVPPAISK